MTWQAHALRVARADCAADATARSRLPAGRVLPDGTPLASPEAMGAYRAAEVDPVAEREALLRLWRANLPVVGDVAAKHLWQYVDAPAGPAQAFLLRPPAEDGTEPQAVGCAGVTTRELWAQGRPVRAALFADFAVDRAHRSGLGALVLQRAVKRHVDAHFDVSYGLPNARAIAVFLRTGYHELGQMRRYVRVLRRSGYLERQVAPAHGPIGRRAAAAVLARAAGAAIDVPAHLLERARAVRPSRSSALVWLADVDDRFDRLWELTRDQVGIAARRDAAFLRWRFGRMPGEPVSIAALLERRTERLRAYAYVRGGEGEGAELQDLFGPPDALDDLLALLPPALYDRGHTAIAMRFLGGPMVPRLLAAHQFSLREARRAVVVSPGASGVLDPATVRDPAAWYLTDLDEDT